MNFSIEQFLFSKFFCQLRICDLNQVLKRSRLLASMAPLVSFLEYS